MHPLTVLELMCLVFGVLICLLLFLNKKREVEAEVEQRLEDEKHFNRHKKPTVDVQEVLSRSPFREHTEAKVTVKEKRSVNNTSRSASPNTQQHVLNNHHYFGSKVYDDSPSSNSWSSCSSSSDSNSSNDSSSSSDSGGSGSCD